MKIDKGAQAPTGLLPNAAKDGAGKPKEALGDTANRIANAGSLGNKPNRMVQGKGNPNLDKDAFFKLMMTQVQNQDPTNPLKSHEMSAQLAQFSSLEQMSNIHGVLNDMKKAQGHDSQYQALDMIGKTISGDNGKIERNNGDGNHDIGFTLNDSASEVKVSIADPKGNIVRVIDMSNVPKGNAKATWDGKDAEGNVLPAGSYKMSAEAKDLQGNKLSVDTQFKGAVTGVQFTERGPVMMIGSKIVPFKDVKQIEVQQDKQAAMSGLANAAAAQQASTAGKPTQAQLSPQAIKEAVAAQGMALGPNSSAMPQFSMPMNLNTKI